MLGNLPICSGPIIQPYQLNGFVMRWYTYFKHRPIFILYIPFQHIFDLVFPIISAFRVFSRSDIWAGSTAALNDFIPGFFPIQTFP